jgi:hypothetical protein
VDVAALSDGADLDAWNQPEAGLTCRGRSGIAAGGRVVIGDADDGQARGAGVENELRRRKRAVGGGGM